MKFKEQNRQTRNDVVWRFKVQQNKQKENIIDGFKFITDQP